ncbi:hypothetical protein MLD38_040690 [Melastoma candidum]|nr:hypothetical protein MLD38_040690 [Melastoma candidum]
MAENYNVPKPHVGNPPIFDGKNFAYWKIRMSAFVDAIDEDLWSYIEDGPPSIPENQRFDREGHPTREYLKIRRLTKTAKYLMFNAMSEGEFVKVSTCTSGKEIWDKLVTMYIGTDQIRETKVNFLIHQYENFTMKADESVEQMFQRLNLLVDALTHLGKTYQNSELVRKVLRTLPKSWEAKKTAIEEAKDLSILRLDQLMSSLISYEMERSSQPDIKRAPVAFRASEEPTEGSDDEAEADSDDELAMIAKRLLRFASKKRFNKRSQKHMDPKLVTCFECKKKGHYKTECPLLKEKEKPSPKYKFKKAIASWAELDDSDDEEAQVCLTTHTETQNELHTCFQTETVESEWYLDSGCSRHMTGDPSKFSQLTLQCGGSVKFGDNSKGSVIGKGTIGSSDSMVIDEVLLVTELKHNLLSISQLCDKGYKITFDQDKCSGVLNNEVRFIGNRKGNIYTLTQNSFCTTESCLLTVKDESLLWHRRLGHSNFKLLSKLVKKDLVKGLPNIRFEHDSFCEACSLGKQTKSSFKSKNEVSTSQPLELLHMDLFGPTRVQSVGGRRYCLVVVDDYSRYTWVKFLTHKSDAFETFIKLAKKLQNEIGSSVKAIRTDHGTEFENHDFATFCDDHGKFEAKTDEGIFLGYSLSSKAYRVLNKRTSTIEESINVKINDIPTIITRDVISQEPTEDAVESHPL